MTDGIMSWLACIRHGFVRNPGRVLEVGSYDENGSPRYVFGWGATEYVGIDIRGGPGVDIVGDFHTHPLFNHPFFNKFDTVICTEMLEHDQNPVASVRKMRALLHAGGHLILTSPTNGFPEHRYPKDYWRLMPDAYTDVLLVDMEILHSRVVGQVGDQCNCYLARKPVPPPPEPTLSPEPTPP